MLVCSVISFIKRENKGYIIYLALIFVHPLGVKTPQLRNNTPPPTECNFKKNVFNVNLRKHLNITPNFKFLQITLIPWLNIDVF